MSASPRPKGQAPSAESSWSPAPTRALLVTISAIFLAEIVIRILLAVSPPLPQVLEALVDVLVISGVVLAGLLLFVYAPMKRYLAQRDRAERELRLQASVAVQNSESLAVADLEGNLQFVNPAFAAMHGYSPDELLGKNLSVFHSSEQMPSVDAAISQIKESGEFHGEIWHIRRDGSAFPTWIHNSLLRDEQYRPVGIIGTVRDITEEKRTQTALRESEERLRGILQHSPSVIFLKDPEGRYLLINRRYEEIFHITNGEIQGKTDYDRFPKETADALRKNDQTVLSAGIPLVLDEEVPHDDGLHSYLSMKFLVKNAEGENAGVCGIATDISERKRAEEERLNLERQLQHAQKLESLGVLAGGIAHDFNNLLTTILGNAALALQDLSPHAPARYSVKEIEKASLRAAGLAKQMLAYSGKGKFVIEPIHLNELVEEMTHLLQASISKKAIMRFDMTTGLPAFEGDATQIRQVIMNLITNASDAMGDQSGAISIATGVIDCDRRYLDEIGAAFRNQLEEPLPEGAYIFVDVADTGSGMSRETLQRIFDPFFTTKRTGRGLGMAAVLGIVRGHKGLISVNSEVDKGTTFRVLFPASQEGSAAAYARSKGETGNEAWSGRGTILVADDEESVRLVARRMLERFGFSVLTAADGREAVQVFREHADEIACVLLDLTMPFLDGEQVFREMRAIRPDVKAILTSGYNEQEATERFGGKGLSGFLQKPFQQESLSEMLRETLEGH
jgi:two-component system cell cycle sensor histidine kinase/response regulator CckA